MRADGRAHGRGGRITVSLLCVRSVVTSQSVCAACQDLQSERTHDKDEDVECRGVDDEEAAEMSSPEDEGRDAEQKLLQRIEHRHGS